MSAVLSLLLDHGEREEAIWIAKQSLISIPPVTPPLSLLTPLCEVMEDPGDIQLIVQCLMVAGTVVSVP